MGNPSILPLERSLKLIARKKEIGVCGQKGSITERIQDCKETNDDLTLVARSWEGEEVFQDNEAKFWSPTLKNEMNFSEAVRACEKLRNAAGVTGVTWRLPFIEDMITSVTKEIEKPIHEYSHSEYERVYVGKDSMGALVYENQEVIKWKTIGMRTVKVKYHSISHPSFFSKGETYWVDDIKGYVEVEEFQFTVSRESANLWPEFADEKYKVRCVGTLK